jgi:hypothetical protein
LNGWVQACPDREGEFLLRRFETKTTVTNICVAQKHSKDERRVLQLHTFERMLFSNTEKG